MAAVTPEVPPVEVEAIEAARALSSCAALLSRVAGRALAPWGMSWPQAMSLLLLRARDEPATATQLVDQLGLGRTAMTAVVDRLQRRGWVRRTPHDRDRRVTLVALTEEGRRIADDAALAVARALDGALDRSQLPILFDSLTAQLNRQADT